jgi:hypothetical protein
MCSSLLSSSPKGANVSRSFIHYMSSYNMATYNILTYNILTYNILTYNILTYNILTYNILTYNISTHLHVNPLHVDLLMPYLHITSKPAYSHVPSPFLPIHCRSGNSTTESLCYVMCRYQPRVIDEGERQRRE